jgi:hypothetical protein
MARHDIRAASSVVPFLCECGSSLCCERVWLTPDSYAMFRDAGVPMLAPGHDPPPHPGELRQRQGPVR